MTLNEAHDSSRGVPGDGFSSRDALLGWVQEIAPYGIFTTDTALRVQSWNQWLATHSGLSAEQVIGRPLVELFPAIATRRMEERYRRALEGEISFLSSALHKYLLPFEVTRPDGDVQHMLQTARIAPLPGAGSIVGTITIMEDVTERESQAATLQRQQDHDRLLSRALAVLLQSADPMSDVTDLLPMIAPSLGIEAFFSHVFEADAKTFRLSAAAGISSSLKDALAALSLDQAACEAWAAKRELTVVNHLQADRRPELELLRSAGLRFFCCYPLWVGDRLFGSFSVGSYSRDTAAADEVKFLSTLAQYVGMALDRTLREAELREAQLTLSKHAENLELKVSERTARLHDTISQLESFSYSIAHDLRAPIRSLKGYAEVLMADYAQVLPDEGRFIIQRLERASRRLDALTRDLLQFSKIAQQDVQLAPVDLAELIHDITSLNPALEIVLTLQPPLGKVWAQRTLLQQCFSNLFDNALKFTKPGVLPHIVVRTERTRAVPPSSSAQPFAAFNPSTRPPFEPPPGDAAAKGGGLVQNRLVIWVEDRGIGIAPQAHEKIFGIFERVAGLETVEGTGIGLAIVARAMQRMGGRCGVESEVDQGSRFWLELAETEDTQ